MVEDTEKQPDHTVRVFSPVYPGQNLTRQGADIRAGQLVLQPGDVLNPSRIGAVAALGIIDVEVYAQPRVAILSTGNEVVDPGQPLKPGHIYDINKFTLGAVLREHGACPVPYPTAPDNVPDLTRAIEACLAEDVILFSGGSSVGERDLILDVVERMGEVLFHGIAVKPGKPTLFGTITGKPVFGMPGYPTSCLSNAYMLLIGPIRRLARLPEWAPRIAAASPRPARRVDHRAAPVLHGPDRGWAGHARVQGVGRHHEHVAGRRLHRDPGAGRRRRKGRARRREALLRPPAMSKLESSTLKAGDRAPLFTLPNQKGAPVSLEAALAKGPVLLGFHRGTW